MSAIAYGAAVLLLLNLIIALHEVGHLLVARRLGLAVPEYNVGLGKRLLHRNVRGTEVALRVLPLGGYVVCPELERVHPARRIAVSLAGPAIQLVAAWAVLTLGGHPIAAAQLVWRIMWAGFSGMGAVPVAAWHIVTGADRNDGMAGPVGIVTQGSHVLQGGWLLGALTLFVLLNVGIATLNLLPLPPLDGGHVAMALLRWARVPAAIVTGVQVAVSLVVVALVATIMLGDVFNPSA